jgi:hypothetical protein
VPSRSKRRADVMGPLIQRFLGSSPFDPNLDVYAAAAAYSARREDFAANTTAPRHALQTNFACEAINFACETATPKLPSSCPTFL